MENFFPLMISFVEEAGTLALKFIAHSSPSLKPDSSVITRADKAISTLAHKKLAGLVKTGEHLLIDEEDPQRGEYLNQDTLRRTPFLWSIDPIDATRAYANRMPHYGISIGLIKNLKPCLGAVYFPSLKELFYCDGQDAYFVQEAFTLHEKKTLIAPVDETISSRSVFIVTDNIIDDFEWRSEDCRIMILSAAVCEFCWPSIGRGCGSLSRVHLWDMAGSWPIFEKAGLKMRSFETGKPLEKIDASLFETGHMPWRLKGYYILSSEKNYPVLHDKLREKIHAKS
ncbi:MAG: hypothetical protein HQL16_00010 [Candidatus Omnitrophica bacterium]|nr:hypothetical protein [Candidatus Omnitrophota bacterium]